MLKKNKELNVFHHVWSHLTTSAKACLSSPSDPRCVQPCYRSKGKGAREASKGDKRPPSPKTRGTTAVLCHLGALTHHQNRTAWCSFSPQAPSTTRVCRLPRRARSNRTPKSVMKAAKISPPDTRSSRISIRFDRLGFSWDVGAEQAGGWSASSWTSPSETSDWHLAPWSPCPSEIRPDGVRDLKRWLMWEIVCSVTCQDVSATMCGQASWTNGACGPGLLLFSW